MARIAKTIFRMEVNEKEYHVTYNGTLTFPETPKQRKHNERLMRALIANDDLLNFCSELSTHHREILRNTHAWDAEIGRMLAGEFDLEDMYKNSREARDFQLNGLELTNERTDLRNRFANRNQVFAHE